MSRWAAERGAVVRTVHAQSYEEAMTAAKDLYDLTSSHQIHLTKLDDDESITVYPNVGIRLEERSDGWNAKAHINNMDRGQLGPGGVTFEYVDEVVLYGGAVLLAANPVEIHDVCVRVRSWDQDGETRASLEVAGQPSDLTRGQ